MISHVTYRVTTTYDDGDTATSEYNTLQEAMATVQFVLDSPVISLNPEIIIQPIPHDS